MPNNQEQYLATVAELQELAKKGPFITQDWILEVASMSPDDMRRRLLVNYDWHRRFAACLDGIKEIKVMPGAAPDGCWEPKRIRNVVEQLIAACSTTWEHNCFGSKKEEPAPRVKKDHEIAALVNALRDVAVEFHAAQQLRARIANLVLDFVKPSPTVIPGPSAPVGTHDTSETLPRG